MKFTLRPGVNQVPQQLIPPRFRRPSPVLFLWQRFARYAQPLRKPANAENSVYLRANSTSVG
jgi:hypothetical protein